MGRRAKSIHLHLMDGNTSKKTKEEIERRKAAEESLKTGADKVKPPQWLCREGKKEFRRLTKQLLEVDMVTNLDVDMLAKYCKELVLYRQTVAIIEAEGLLVEHTNKSGATNTVQHPLLPAKKAMFDTCYKLAQDFGFTPSARAKIAIHKQKDETEPTEFEQKFGDV